MATGQLSEYNAAEIPSAKDMHFGIVTSAWNSEITGKLTEGAIETLIKHGALQENIYTAVVPGSFELPMGGQWMAETNQVDAVILLGCVIQGETRHFDYICQGVTQGTVDLNLKYNIPFIFGVLTTDNQEQASDRAGGKYGNKGVEAAVTAIQMVSLSHKIKASKK